MQVTLATLTTLALACCLTGCAVMLPEPAVVAGRNDFGTQPHNEFSCSEALSRNLTSPFRPGFVCMRVVSADSGQGASSSALRPAMRAVRLNGRIYLLRTDRSGLEPLPQADHLSKD